MKIILEGTKAELKDVLYSFSIPAKFVYDDGSQFLCGDMCGRGHRQKKSDRTIGELIKKHYDVIKEFSAENNVPDKPEPLADALNSPEVDIDLTIIAENALKRAVKFKVFYNGIKINNAVYTFGKPEDMWKYVGETVNVIGNQVFDSRGNFVGRVNKQFKIIGRNIDD